MRRILLPLSAICILATASFGQMAFHDNQNVGSVGLGIGYYSDMNVPPITFTLEHGINEDISLGGVIGYTGSRNYWDDGYDYYYSYNYLLIGARGSYHFDVLHDRKFDTYAGLLLGYNFVWHDHYGDPYTGSYRGSFPAFGVHVGGRYYFAPKVAFQAELGYGELSILNAGLCFKL